LPQYGAYSEGFVKVCLRLANFVLELCLCPPCLLALVLRCIALRLSGLVGSLCLSNLLSQAGHQLVLVTNLLQDTQ
jgi:hypothetical protein